MSLKAFHIVFIFLSMLLFAGCAVWSGMNEVSGGLTWACAGVSVLAFVYGIYFINKARKIIV